MRYAEELARQSITREARAFAGAIESDLNDWTEDECRTFLRQFAAHVQEADAVVAGALVVDGGQQ